MARGPERAEDGPEERRDRSAKGRRWGRGRADAEPDEATAGEEFGWIDDLRTAKQQRGELGPDGEGPGPRTGAVPPVRGAMPSAGPGARPGVPEPEPPRGPRSAAVPPPAGRPGPDGPPRRVDGPATPPVRPDGPDPAAGRRRPLDGLWPGTPGPGRQPAEPPRRGGDAATGQLPPGPPVTGRRGGPAGQPGRATPPAGAAGGPVPPTGPAPDPGRGGPARARPGPASGAGWQSGPNEPRGGVPPTPRGRHGSDGPGGPASGPHPAGVDPSLWPVSGGGRRGVPAGVDTGAHPVSGAGRRSLPDGTEPGIRPVSGAGRRAAEPGNGRHGVAAARAVAAPTGPDHPVVDPAAPRPADADPRRSDRPDPSGTRGVPRVDGPVGARAGGRRRAEEPDQPAVVPGSGNAPPAPGVPSGGPRGEGPAASAGRRVARDAPTGRRDAEATTRAGRRRAADDTAPPSGSRTAPDDAPTRAGGRGAAEDSEASAGRPPQAPEGRRAAGAAPGPRRVRDDADEPHPQRPERPADWLRQAGRTSHTDSLPTVARPTGSPVGEPTSGRPTVPGGPDRTPSGRAAAAVPPVQADRSGPARAAARTDGPGATGGVPAIGDPRGGDPRGSAPAGGPRGGGPAAGDSRGDGPVGGPRGVGPARGAARPGAEGPVAPRTPGDDGRGPLPGGEPGARTGGPAVARAAASVPRPGGPDERPAGRATPSGPEANRPGPGGPVAVPPPGAGGPAVARAAAVVPPGEPAGPRPGPGDGPALRRAEAEPAEDAGVGGGLRGARSELRRQMRERRRLRMGILALVSLVLLGAVPLFFGLRTLSRDPVFDTLDGLDMPSWAAEKTVDNVSGNRWCLQDCRLRERTAESQQAWKETAQVYEQALTKDGWRRWKVDRCPEQQVKGSYTCWRRDELTLDLWVREPTCVPPPVDGESTPSPAPSPAAGTCTGSLVSVKVRNAIDDERTGPQPSTDPSLTGEDPYPSLTGDPLGELTRSPS